MPNELLTNYTEAAKKMSAATLRKDLARMRGSHPELAGAAAYELAARGEPEEEPRPPFEAQFTGGFHFRPSATIDGRSAIDLWRGDQLVGTIYARRGGVHIVCMTGFEPGAMTVELQEPHGVVIDLEGR